MDLITPYPKNQTTRILFLFLRLCYKVMQVSTVTGLYLINFSHLLVGCIFRPALCVLRRCVFRPALGWLIIHCYILSR